MLRNVGSIKLSKPSGEPRLPRTSRVIQQVKQKLQQSQVSMRSVAKEMRISKSPADQLLKEDTMRVLFPDEKLFDADGIYNAENQRLWAVGHAEADE